MLGLMPQLTALCLRTSAEILSLYGRREQLAVARKADDTLLTRADLLAHEMLAAGLQEILPLDLVSEEAEHRVGLRDYWLIDPIDGTREFVEETGNFCLCIARILDHRPVFGLIFAPVSGHYYYAQEGAGSFASEGGAVRQIHCQDLGHRLITARPKVAAHIVKFAEALLGPNYEHQTRGSALKFCTIAAGRADVYPKLSRATSEWDIAAGHIILQEAGGFIRHFDGSEPRYGLKESMLNPPFVACASEALLERALQLKALLPQ